MSEFIYILVSFVLIFIQAITLAMSLRAILSWFTDGSGKFSQFLYILTEPAIMPIRKLFVRLNWFQESPFDFSFLFTYIALAIIELLLSAAIA